MIRSCAFIVFSTVPLFSQVVAMNDSGVAMGHLHIYSADPDAHRKLWVDTLGGKPVKARALDLVMFPGVFVAVRKAEPTGGTEGSVIDHLGFLVRDLAGTKQKLIAAGVPIVRELPATKQFFAMLPDKVKVEFSEDSTIDVPIKHHHVHFATNEIEPMRAWYAATFGAVPGRRAKFQAADLPGVNLTWNPAESRLAASTGRSVDHIGFEVRDIEEMCRKLQASGLKLEMPPTKRPDLGLTIAFFSDPYGTRIELTQGLVAVGKE
jgi:catechol 2,3-dioxygenase-like lactoylglutathione lyase family enzyme